MPIILHLMPVTEWELSADSGYVTNASLVAEGFIHCTDAPSVMLQVANAFYRQRPGDFVVLHIDVEALTSRCVWEAPAHIATRGATDADSDPAAVAFAPSFPHVFGPIERGAIRAVQPVTRDGSGAFTGYGELGPSA